VQGCACHCEFTLAYDPSDEDETGRVKKIFKRSCEEFIESGAFFNRPHNSVAELVFSKDKSTASALRKVKNIFDPKNILNPGKLCF
jgi:FAD/FMN-containing dehydrogenase